MDTVEGIDWNDLESWMKKRADHLAEVTQAVRMLHRKRFAHRLAKELWKAALFNATEYPAKYCTRFFSSGVLALLRIPALSRAEQVLRIQASDAEKKDPRGMGLGIRHDHVWSRKWLRKRLSEENADIEALLNEHAWGCVLLKSEHDLDAVRNGEGWKKYQMAGVEVFDVLKGQAIK